MIKERWDTIAMASTWLQYYLTLYWANDLTQAEKVKMKRIKNATWLLLLWKRQIPLTCEVSNADRVFWLGATQQLPSGKRDPPMDPLFFLQKKLLAPPKRSKFSRCAALTRGLRFVAEGIGVYVLICPSQQKVKIVDFSTHLMSWRPLAASRPYGSLPHHTHTPHSC